jgi:D-tyrosyl-tRNA(Tyr) deacylase
MKVVLQRVSRARVTVDDQEVGRIGKGLCLLVGIGEGDGPEEVEWMIDKVIGLRVFDDGEGKMNLALEEVDGEILVVSQFTLYGDTSKGRRPSFVHAADPETALDLYDVFVQKLERRLPGAVASGEFGEMMEVEMVNDGPVTLILER